MAHSIPELLQKNEIDSLKELLGADPNLANGKTEQGLSYLQLATYYRNKEAIALLRENKNSIDLHEAAAIGDPAAVRFQISITPDLIDSYSTDGFTALGLACFFGHVDVVKYLIDKGANVNKPSSNSFHVAPIHSAAAISDYEIISLLLAHGADVNVRQQGGVTPLHSAGHNGQTKIAKLLIDHGADTDAKTDDGKTAVDMALEKNYTETADFIRSCSTN
ncbi:MAG TPA: ankyrin repeat domain-containing protein [Cyclobacteriaceae bacterium]|nr:ankyrin repeat domain-containing protein [Cyclobacteriaceae bacterium]